MVRYREIRPSVALEGFVECFWMLEQAGGDAAPQRVVPDGHPELILNLGDPFEFFWGGEWQRQPRCFLAGQIEGPLLLRPSGETKMLGVRFRPQGAARVFDAPMHELAGKFTSVADLSPALSKELERAMNSGNLVGGVEAALASGEKKADAMVAEAARRIVLARGASDLVRLAGELGVGIRQLERRFNTSVGLPPKLFGRMQRFMHVFRVIQEQPYTWVDAAIHCGYYDQAHLIRDFRNFSGETPAALLTGSADLARHFYSGLVLERFGVSHLSNTVQLESV